MRRKFGDGYQLVLARDDRYDDRDKNSNGYQYFVTSNRSQKQEENPYESGIKSEDSFKKLERIRRNHEKAAEKLTEFVQRIFPQATLTKTVGVEITFTLPYEGLSSGKFLQLLDALEANKKQLGITDYGLSDTTLEDIFIKVADTQPADGEVFYEKKWFYHCLCGCFCGCCACGKKLCFKKIEAEPEQDTVVVKERTDEQKTEAPITTQPRSSIEENLDPKRKSQAIPDDESGVSVGAGGNVAFRKATRPQAVTFAERNTPKLTGTKLRNQQFAALLVKRWHHTRKDQRAFFSQIILPAIFIMLAMLFAMLMPSSSDQPSLELQVYMYGDGLYMIVTDTSNGDPVMGELVKELEKPPHHGTRCLGTSEIDGRKCIKSPQPDFSKPKMPKFLQLYDPYSWWPSPQCHCESGYPDCMAMAGGAVPPRKILDTTEKLQNMTSRNVTDYTLKTRLDYKMKRLYGYEFQGERRDFEVDSAKMYRASKAVEKFLKNNKTSTPNEFGFSLYNVVKDLNLIFNDTLAEKNIMIWWNNNAIHGIPAVMNGLNNLILRSVIPDEKARKDYGIVAYSHPWKVTSEQVLEKFVEGLIKDVIVALFVIFALGFIPASFVLFLIEERVSKSKHLQYVSGVNPNIYWFSTFTWDYLNYLISVLIVILIFIAFDQEPYIAGMQFPCLLLLFLLYGWSITPLMYPISYLFKVPSTAYVILILFNGFVGIITTVTTYMLELFPDMADTNVALKAIFLIFPQYCLGRGLFNMIVEYKIAITVSEIGDYNQRNPLAFGVAGLHLMCLAIQGFVFFACIIGIEHHYVVRRALVLKKRKQLEQKLRARRGSTVRFSQLDDEDVYEIKQIESDVKTEQQKVLAGQFNKEPVIVRQLRKEYKSGKGKFLAVKNLTFHVPKNSCFGLLGINGAGKTTTFTMLTGDVLPSGGQAIVGGYDVVTHVNESRKKLGFCPQFDALDNFLTVKEHLMLYARLRGIERKFLNFVTDSVIEKMGLIKYSERQAGTLSGGNKRKLSTAIALVGDPQIIFLDEPTAGMDPKARRLDKFEKGRIERGRNGSLSCLC